jgi:hypothetical protein
MFRKCSGIAVLTSMVSSHPEICKTGMHPPGPGPRVGRWRGFVFHRRRGDVWGGVSIKELGAGLLAGS